MPAVSEPQQVGAVSQQDIPSLAARTRDSGLSRLVTSRKPSSLPSRERVSAAIALVRAKQAAISAAAASTPKNESKNFGTGGFIVQKAEKLSEGSKVVPTISMTSTLTSTSSMPKVQVGYMPGRNTKPSVITTTAVTATLRRAAARRQPLSPVERPSSEKVVPKQDGTGKPISNSSSSFIQNVFASRSEVKGILSSSALPNFPSMTDNEDPHPQENVPTAPMPGRTMTPSSQPVKKISNVSRDADEDLSSTSSDSSDDSDSDVPVDPKTIANIAQLLDALHTKESKAAEVDDDDDDILNIRSGSASEEDPVQALRMLSSEAISYNDDDSEMSSNDGVNQETLAEIGAFIDAIAKKPVVSVSKPISEIDQNKRQILDLMNRLEKQPLKTDAPSLVEPAVTSPVYEKQISKTESGSRANDSSKSSDPDDTSSVSSDTDSSYSDVADQLRTTKPSPIYEKLEAATRGDNKDPPAFNPEHDKMLQREDPPAAENLSEAVMKMREADVSVAPSYSAESLEAGPIIDACNSKQMDKANNDDGNKALDDLSAGNDNKGIESVKLADHANKNVDDINIGSETTDDTDVQKHNTASKEDGNEMDALVSGFNGHSMDFYSDDDDMHALKEMAYISGIGTALSPVFETLSADSDDGERAEKKLVENKSEDVADDVVDRVVDDVAEDVAEVENSENTVKMDHVDVTEETQEEFEIHAEDLDDVVDYEELLLEALGTAESRDSDVADNVGASAIEEKAKSIEADPVLEEEEKVEDLKSDEKLIEVHEETETNAPDKVSHDSEENNKGIQQVLSNGSESNDGIERYACLEQDEESNKGNLPSPEEADDESEQENAASSSDDKCESEDSDLDSNNSEESQESNDAHSSQSSSNSNGSLAESRKERELHMERGRDGTTGSIQHDTHKTNNDSHLKKESGAGETGADKSAAVKLNSDLPHSPSLKTTDQNDAQSREGYDSVPWELRDIASEETMKAAGRTRPRNVFTGYRKSNAIKSLLSDDSSAVHSQVYPIESQELVENNECAPSEPKIKASEAEECVQSAAKFGLSDVVVLDEGDEVEILESSTFLATSPERDDDSSNSTDTANDEENDEENDGENDDDDGTSNEEPEHEEPEQQEFLAPIPAPSGIGEEEEETPEEEIKESAAADPSGRIGRSIENHEDVLKKRPDPEATFMAAAGTVDDPIITNLEPEPMDDNETVPTSSEKHLYYTVSSISKFFTTLHTGNFSFERLEKIRNFQEVVAHVIGGARPSVIEAAQIRQAAQKANIALDVVDIFLEFSIAEHDVDLPTNITSEEDDRHSLATWDDNMYNQMYDLNEDEAIGAFLSRVDALKSAGNHTNDPEEDTGAQHADDEMPDDDALDVGPQLSDYEHVDEAVGSREYGNDEHVYEGAGSQEYGNDENDYPNEAFEVDAEFGYVERNLEVDERDDGFDEVKEVGTGFIDQFVALDINEDDADAGEKGELGFTKVENPKFIINTECERLDASSRDAEDTGPNYQSFSDIAKYFASLGGDGTSKERLGKTRQFQRLVAPVISGDKPSLIESAQIRQAAQKAKIPLDIVDRFLELAEEDEDEMPSVPEKNTSNEEQHHLPENWDDEMDYLNEDEAIGAFLSRFGALKSGGHIRKNGSNQDFDADMENVCNDEAVEVDAVFGYVNKNLEVHEEEQWWEGMSHLEKKAAARSQAPDTVKPESDDENSEDDGSSVSEDHGTNLESGADDNRPDNKNVEENGPSPKPPKSTTPKKAKSTTPKKAKSFFPEEEDDDLVAVASASFAYDTRTENAIWHRKKAMASYGKRWEQHSRWLSPRNNHIRDPKPIDGVAAAERLGKFAFSKRVYLAAVRPWKMPYKERTKNHSGFFNVDVFSVYESSAAHLGSVDTIIVTPWEHREVQQRFLQERSISFSRNWFGSFSRVRGNPKYKQPFCKPKSMEMPIENIPDPGEWTEEWYKSPYGNRNPLGASGSSDASTDDGSFSDTERGSLTDRGSVTDVSAANPKSVGSHGGSDYSDSSSAASDDATWEEAPECGTLVNVKQKIGERVSRVHPDYTSSLRRSRWRKKYFPRGTFPYK